MARYKWLQQRGGDETWTVFLADQEERIIRERRPAFTTILAADNDFTGQMSAEDYAKVHYFGPYYADFDASSIDEVTPKFIQYLKRLRDEHQFDLEQAHLFASGGKGYHVLIPESCFMEKPNARGITHLPAIYREMSMELYTDTLDLRTYTARRGRQFRTPNVERSDRPNVYKVPLTVEEALNITPEIYRELCSAPRHVAPPLPPTYNTNLGLIFAQARDKVDKAAKSVKKSKLDANLLKKFGGDFPPSILALMKGENVGHDVGFQKIALQLSLAAHALGKTEDVFLGLCEGLCENHVSDGVRYNTPAKRRVELARMYQYTKDNPCYTFSIGATKSVIDKEAKTPDLDNGGVDIGEDEEDEGVEWSLSQGMRVSSKGIYKKTEDGLVKVSAVGLSDPRQLIDTDSGDTIGYEVGIFLDGKPRGAKVLTMDAFHSRQKLLQFTLAAGGSSVNATDVQVGAIAEILRSRTAKSGQQVYTTGREGLDLIRHGDQVDIVWADNEKVVSSMNLDYRLVGKMVAAGEYKTDLIKAPMLKATDDSGEFFTRLFRLNKREVLGRMLGWYLISFYNQPLRYLYNQFPSLQCFGAAGSGKSKTNELLVNMHYWKSRPRIQSAVDATPFVIDTLVSSSASIPLVLDEFKPREMDKRKLDKLKTMLRGNYTSHDLSRGWKSSDTGQSKFDVRSVQNLAPIVIIGEALENQAAILERSVVVAFDKTGKRGHAQDFMYCQNYKENLSMLGRHLLEVALHVNFEKTKQTVMDNIMLVSDAVADRADDNDRPVYNTAVVLSGLQLGKVVMNRVFGTTFDHDFDEFRDSIVSHKETIIPRSLSEASRVLDTLAHLTYANMEEEKNTLQFGVDYVVNPIKQCIEIHLRNAYTKYVRYKKSISEEVLYDNYEMFVAAMNNYSCVTDRVCIDSPLKVSASTHVYEFSVERLDREGVGVFKEK